MGAAEPDIVVGTGAVSFKAVLEQAEQASLHAEQAFRSGEAAIWPCWVNGGRLWNVDIDSLSYKTRLVELGIMPTEENSLVGHVTRFTVCMPWDCAQMAQFGATIDALLRVGLFQPPFPVAPELVRLDELSHWKELPYDFVLAGVDKCGTTSLRMNLAKHPDIHFSPGDDDILFEDTLFTWSRTSRMSLPTRELVERRRVAAAALRGAGGSGRPQLVGVYNAIIFREPYARQALHRMPDLKVLMVACSPVRRFFAMEDKNETLTNASAVKRALFKNMADKLLTPHLKDMERLFEGRLMMVPQSHLMEGALYNQIARFLDVAPFPPGTDFDRFHVSGRSRRSIGCTNASVASWLQRQFVTDVDTIQSLFSESKIFIDPVYLHPQAHCYGDEPIGCSNGNRTEPC